MSADCGITEIAEEVAATGVEAASSNGAVLFACTAHAGQINPLLSIAGELSRRDVPALWFAKPLSTLRTRPSRCEQPL